MSDPVEQLTAWLCEQAQQQRAGAAVALSHMGGDGSLTACERVSLADDPSEDDMAHAVGRLYHAAALHAEAFPTPQTYQISAAAADGSDLATRLFRVAGAGPSGLSPTEPPNDHGLVRMLMRHLEAQTRVNATLVATQVKQMGDQLERAQARIAQLEQQRADSLEQIESVALHNHEREIDRLRVTASEARKADAVQTLKLLAPGVVKAAATRFGLPLGADGDTAQLAEWLKSLDFDQVKAMCGSLQPAQQVAFLQLWQQLALPGEALAEDPEPDDEEQRQ